MSEKQKNIESNALSPIPQEQRMNWKNMALIQAGICVCVPAFLLGALLAESMSVTSAVLAGTTGYVIVVAVMLILGMLGSDLGVPTVITCQSGMGVHGARFVVGTIFAVNMIGWFGIQNGECGLAFSNFLQSEFGINFPVWASSALWGLIMLTTAVFGVNALKILDQISIPLLLIIMALGTYLAISKYGLAGMNGTVEEGMGFMAGVGLSFSFYAVGAVAPADFTRFQRTRKDVVKSTILGVFPMGVLTLVIGILLTKIAAEFDISIVLIAVGIPILGILALVLSTWTTNSTNAYTAALSIVKLFNIPDNRRREVTAIAGLLGTILGAIGILNNITDVLSMLAFITAPIGGVMIADYWLIGRGKPENWAPVKNFNIAGMLAWIIASAISYYFYIEFLGLIVGAALYIPLIKLIPVKNKLEEVTDDLVLIDRKG